MRVAWRKRKLEEIVEVQSGGTPSKSVPEYWDGEIAWYSSGELNGPSTLAPLRTITEEGLANSNAKLFPEGSLLIGMYDTAALKMAVLDREAAFNQAIAAAKPNPGVNLFFIMYAVEAAKPELLQQRRGVRQKNLSLLKIKNFELPFPSRSEQDRIVTILNEAFRMISASVANTEKNLANARELFDNYLNSVFTQKREGWTVATLGDLCQFRRGLTYKKSDEVESSRNAVLRANNITVETGEINLSDIRFIRDEIEIPDSKKVARNCLLVCTASGSKNHLGKIALIENDLGHAFGGFMGLLVPSDTVLPKYLFWSTRSCLYKDFISDLSDGININNLKWAQLSQFTVLLPSLPEQKRIVAILDTLTAQTNRLESIYQHKLADLAELKQSLLHKAFSGELTAQPERSLQEAVA